LNYKRKKLTCIHSLRSSQRAESGKEEGHRSSGKISSDGREERMVMKPGGKNNL